jgi:hypothetical protein
MQDIEDFGGQQDLDSRQEESNVVSEGEARTNSAAIQDSDTLRQSGPY